MFALIVVLCTSLVGVSLVRQQAHALNTHSVDLERSSSQYLSITDGSQTGLDLAGDFTIEAWVKVESSPAASEEYTIAGKYNNNGVNERAYLFNYQRNGADSNDQLRAIVSSDGSSASIMQINQPLSTSTWHHVAVVYAAASGVATFYVDGSSAGTASGGPSSIHNSTADFQIGGFQSGGGSPYFDGLIDDVRVWNIARTATQISDDMSREINGNETGLVGYWKLNNSLADSSANGNTLSNNGGATHSTDTAFAGFSAESLKVRKTTNESLASSTILQNDDELKLSLAANKTYIVDGVIFASSTSASPDIVLGFFGQSNVTVTIAGANDANNEVLLRSGASSAAISLPANTPVSIHIKGTVKTEGTSGDFQLKWAQGSASADATTVMAGSYLRAEAI